MCLQISTETSMTPQGPANRSTLLIDSSPKLFYTPYTQQVMYLTTCNFIRSSHTQLLQGSFTDGQDAPPPSQYQITPPTDTLIKVSQYMMLQYQYRTI